MKFAGTGFWVKVSLGAAALWGIFAFSQIDEYSESAVGWIDAVALVVLVAIVIIGIGIGIQVAIDRIAERKGK